MVVHFSLNRDYNFPQGDLNKEYDTLLQSLFGEHINGKESVIRLSNTTEYPESEEGQEVDPIVTQTVIIGQLSYIDAEKNVLELYGKSLVITTKMVDYGQTSEVESFGAEQLFLKEIPIKRILGICSDESEVLSVKNSVRNYFTNRI